MRESVKFAPPSSILVVGAGVFGLSTTLSLLLSPRYASTHITLLDTHAPSPKVGSHHAQSSTGIAQDVDDSFNPHAASIDTSRIVRADYSNPIYTSLASEAQERWRSDKALSKHYHECGLAVLGNRGQSGWQYIEKSRHNVASVASDGQCREPVEDEEVHGLPDEHAIKEILGTGGSSGEAGYINRRSGWADAGAAMSEVRRRVTALAAQQGRNLWRRGKAERLLITEDPPEGSNRRLKGVHLDNASEIHADLTILAAGAWTSSLLDLHGIVEATGQVVTYIPLSPTERQKLQNMPVLLNLATGMFAIPPPSSDSPDAHLKIARHAFGYRNPTTITDSKTRASRTVSLPSPQFTSIPPTAEHECRTFLATLVPWLAGRAFSSTRLCWYCDTPEGNFVVDYHPEIEGLFLATGGSGHAFKFLPVLGEKVVEGLEGRLEAGLRAVWRWPVRREFGGTEDGSRGGRRETVLGDEMKGGRSKL